MRRGEAERVQQLRGHACAGLACGAVILQNQTYHGTTQSCGCVCARQRARKTCRPRRKAPARRPTFPVVFLGKRCQVQPGHVLAARLVAVRFPAADPPRVASDGRLLDLHSERLNNHGQKQGSAQQRRPAPRAHYLSWGARSRADPAPAEGAGPRPPLAAAAGQNIRPHAPDRRRYGGHASFSFFLLLLLFF